MSQTAIAVEVGVTPQAVALWETGARRPRPENAVRYAEALLLLAAAVGDLPNNDDGSGATEPFVQTPAGQDREHAKQ